MRVRGGLPVGPFPVTLDDPLGWVLVTWAGGLVLTAADVRESGARWNRWGGPANLAAALLGDVVAWYLVDDPWSRWRPIEAVDVDRGV